MPELVREWPRLLQRILEDVRPVPGFESCYAAEVDLTEDELRTLNLFEASARHEHVSFTHPDSREECFAYLNTPVGLGRPRSDDGRVCRVRITFTSVQRMRPVEARLETAHEA